jgi:hypothetical protein
MSVDKCRRIRLDFHAIPDNLYDALLEEFRRQFPEYDDTDWRWDIVASDDEHPDSDAIYHMAETAKMTD